MCIHDIRNVYIHVNIPVQPIGLKIQYDERGSIFRSEIPNAENVWEDKF